MDIDSVYRLYFRDVFLFLQGLTHNEALAEELTQETFFKALDGLKDYDDRQDVQAWLFTVARNAYYSHCRRTKRTAPLEDAETAPADTPDIAQLLVDQDAAFTVHQCLHTLDEPYKEVFSLRVFGELPFERIGLIFGHNAAWARVTYYRAKTQLQKMLSSST
jgi:RNA polymerase sigma factor (sigma-70 family)